eukprot:CAMPEP_0206053324 /NCGR_PEP_ID=MMETSP1466-20131121/35564_1 /ASSEMBLY_ACC=CAM_ASM_001126 /TAXON_ID=44452 /ORGANISM="Pavlova gyrans, Strain CCMP608" /LENGTH=142 /DNA_ID=CAMNT_0053428493 /DNA_START=22 /DNA_END=450 /DNA_ORIENTATION=+
MPGTTLLPRHWWAHLTTAQMNMQVQMGEPHTVRESFDKMLAGHDRELGPDHSVTLWHCYVASEYFLGIGDLSAAGALARRAAEGFERIDGRDHPRTIAARERLEEVDAAAAAPETKDLGAVPVSGAESEAEAELAVPDANAA